VQSSASFYIGAAVHVAISRNPPLLSKRERLYLDHAATTPVLPEARAAFAEALERWANPSSPHAEGREARAALDRARRSIGDALGWRHDVIFTSGASEAIQIAASRARVPGRSVGSTEHDVVPAAFGSAAVRLAVDDDGLIDRDGLARELENGPALVAVQHVNNETGVVQPIAEISAIVRQAGSMLLADCAQSAGKLQLPEADFIAISGHKFGAPPGCGALLVRDLSALEASGGQEHGYRRGTENLPAAAAMAAALQSRAFADASERARELRRALDAMIAQEGGLPIAKDATKSPFIGAYAMPGVASASQLVQFDLAGIAISAGSACASGSMKPSRVLAAMGVPQAIAECTIRVSFGPATESADIERFGAQWLEIKRRRALAAA
jgi:cysteine desulfurase